MISPPLSVLKDLTLVTNGPEIGGVFGFNASPAVIRTSPSPRSLGPSILTCTVVREGHEEWRRP